MFSGAAIRAMLMGMTLSVATIAVSADAQAKNNPQDDLKEGRKVVILHTNDMHGNLEADSKGRGGVDRVASLVRSIKAENPHCVIFLEAGDVAQGTPVSNLFHGDPMFKAIKSMNPAAGTLGNHEFDWGLDVTDKMIKTANYPILAANIVHKNGSKAPYRPYLVKKVNGVKIGIIGLVTPEVPHVVKKGNTGDYVFLDPAETCIKYIPKMYKDGAEVIVALSHCGVDADKELAAKVPAIDVIVGGHSHTRLEEAINVGDHTWIVQADHYARALGQIEMQINPYNGKVYDFKYKLINVDKSLDMGPDPEVSVIAKKYNDEIKPIMDKVVGSLKDELSKTPAEGNYDSSLGSAICDAVRVQSGADIGVYNWGGIRLESMPAGEMKLDAAYRLLPFDDPVVVLEMKGKDVEKLLNQSINMKETGPLQVSGIKMTADDANKTVTSVEVNGKPLDPEATYTVATTEFLSKGGDAYSAFDNGKVTKTIGITRDVFIDYVKSFEGGMPAPEAGRMIKK